MDLIRVAGVVALLAYAALCLLVAGTLTVFLWEDRPSGPVSQWAAALSFVVTLAFSGVGIPVYLLTHV